MKKAHQQASFSRRQDPVCQRNLTVCEIDKAGLVGCGRREGGRLMNSQTVGDQRRNLNTIRDQRRDMMKRYETRKQKQQRKAPTKTLVKQKKTLNTTSDVEPVKCDSLQTRSRLLDSKHQT